MKLFMKNFEKVSERSYSRPQMGKELEVINIESDPVPAIKKSSISMGDVGKKAIKKSSLPAKDVSEGEMLYPRDAERLNKFVKLERNDKCVRAKKPEDSRLTSLLKMRQKFSTKKPNQSQDPKSASPVNPESLYQFSEALQTLTGVKSVETLSNLEFALKFYLRNNSRVLVNSYEFSSNNELCSIFGAGFIKYLDLKSFILNTSKQIS